MNTALNKTSCNVTNLNVDGVQYTCTTVKKCVRRRLTPEERSIAKLAENASKQKDEIRALKIIHNENFVKKSENKFSISFFIHGLPDAFLTFSYPPNYPSDVPPTYSFEASWLKEEKRKELYGILRNVYTEKFGECIVYAWADEIISFLREQRRNVEEETVEEYHEPVEAPEYFEKGPVIYEGNTIADRNSYFTPYLAKVTSEREVRQVIEKIEGCRKVATAFRNTYAYRFMSGSKQVDFGEDGGEPKAGRNLLQRLITYNANDLVVYISRRIGGSLLGSDRYKHLNNAADSVLTLHGYKSFTAEADKKKDNKKYKKQRKFR